MSDTPRTDADLERQSDLYTSGERPIEDSGRIQVVGASFARTLECELASKTEENAALRLEVRQLAYQAIIHCYQGECCPKQKALQPLNKNVCIECTIEQARAEIKAAQAWKDVANG